MKTRLLTLCGCVLFALNGWAQRLATDGANPLPPSPGEHPQASPGQPVSLGDPPFLLVYVVKYGDNAAPRIALGLEKPVLRISAFEKCVRMSHANPNLPGIAAQLMPADARALAAAMKGLAAPDATTLPNTVLWFATPDNQLLGNIDLHDAYKETNIVQAGVLEFEPSQELAIMSYLMEKLHLR